MEELTERLGEQADNIPAYEEYWDEQEICNAPSQCGQIIRPQSNITNDQEVME